MVGWLFVCRCVVFGFFVGWLVGLWVTSGCVGVLWVGWWAVVGRLGVVGWSAGLLVGRVVGACSVGRFGFGVLCWFVGLCLLVRWVVVSFDCWLVGWSVAWLVGLCFGLCVVPCVSWCASLSAILLAGWLVS